MRVNIAMQQFIFLWLAAVVKAASRHKLGEDGIELQLNARVSPRVQESDKAFFKKQYPNDLRPKTDKYYVFGHPYPAVQDGGDYDADFVKDENSDNGEWQAQMRYDTMRKNIYQSKKKLDELKRKMEQAYKDWVDSKSQAGESASDFGKAAADLTRAKAAADNARRTVNDLEGSSGPDGTKVGGEIGRAVKKVEDEMDDLERCKEKLAEARSKLKDLLQEHEEFQKKEAIRKEKELKAKKEAQKIAKEKAAARRARRQAAAKARGGKISVDFPKAGKTFDEEAWRRKLDEEKADHAEAVRNYEKELMDIKKTEDQLARAAENLRKYRRPPYVDDGGGVYNVPGDRSGGSWQDKLKLPRSSASMVGAPLLFAVVVLAAVGV
jgi:hypothetical protein